MKKIRKEEKSTKRKKIIGILLSIAMSVTGLTGVSVSACGAEFGDGTEINENTETVSDSNVQESKTEKDVIYGDTEAEDDFTDGVTSAEAAGEQFLPEENEETEFETGEENQTLNAMADEASGICGDNLTWSIQNDTLTITKMNKKWLTKYQYVYKLAQILSMGDTKELEDTIMHPTFKEIYDYDLERAGLYENLRNKIYDMPIYVFLRILTFAILYNDPTFFDGVYKILKYKVQIDKENHFKVLKKNDTYAKKQIKSLITFMQKISIKFDNKKVFELDRIERYVKLKNYVNH